LARGLVEEAKKVVNREWTLKISSSEVQLTGDEEGVIFLFLEEELLFGEGED